MSPAVACGLLWFSGGPLFNRTKGGWTFVTSGAVDQLMTWVIKTRDELSLFRHVILVFFAGFVIIVRCSMILRLQCLCLQCFDTDGWAQEGHLACKNWVVRYWRGYMSRARCKWFAYGPADATATPSSLAPVKSILVYLSGAGLPRLSWRKAVKRV